MSEIEQAHEQIRGRGYALAEGKKVGLPDPSEFTLTFENQLAPDPRGARKLHTRDVIHYVHGSAGAMAVAESTSVAFTQPDGTIIDDYSRFRLLDARFGVSAAKAILSLIPPGLRRVSGSMSLDWFRYSRGAEAGPHRDPFGYFVIIWCLSRAGGKAENFLLRGGEYAFHQALAPGEVLIFQEDMFLHGITDLTGEDAQRDALIGITLKEPAPR